MMNMQTERGGVTGRKRIPRMKVMQTARGSVPGK